MQVTTRNSTTDKVLCASACAVNGPAPASAPQTANTPKSSTAAELPTTPNRAAAHSSMGSGRHNIAAAATASNGGASSAARLATDQADGQRGSFDQTRNIDELAPLGQPVGDVHHERHHRQDGEACW